MQILGESYFIADAYEAELVLLRALLDWISIIMFN